VYDIIKIQSVQRGLTSAPGSVSNETKSVSFDQRVSNYPNLFANDRGLESRIQKQFPSSLYGQTKEAAYKYNARDRVSENSELIKEVLDYIAPFAEDEKGL
jgi:hypothetical protein